MHALHTHPTSKTQALRPGLCGVLISNAASPYRELGAEPEPHSPGAHLQETPVRGVRSTGQDANGE